MKAISIKNPFASLIANGKKIYEVRSWTTKHRGGLLICSTQKPEKDLWKYYIDFGFGFDTNMDIFETEKVPDGCAVAVSQLVDIIEFDTEELSRLAFVQRKALFEYFGDKSYYLWELRDTVKIDPFPVSGKLGLFDVDFNFPTQPETP